MTTLLNVLDLAVQLAFIALAVGTLANWIRHRDRQRVFLVVALVSLSSLVLVGPITSAAGISGQIVTDSSVVLFLLSGYALLMFRDSLLPLGRRVRVLVTAAIVAVGVIGVAAGFSAQPSTQRTPLQLIALPLIVATWVLCVGEPILRLALSSIGRPAVEGSRLRALSLAYAGLVAVVVVATLAAPLQQNVNFAIATDLVVLAMVPMLYASFSPPVWLRQLWSQPEEEEIRRALHDLLLYSPDRPTVGERAADWAARLVGAAGAFIVDSDGTILAAHGVTQAQAEALKSTPKAGRSTIEIPLELASGTGAMTILPGTYTPVFGEWEMSRLRAYAVSITAGLDRVSLTGRIAALEKAKTEFLNIASHELRSPMTVIKGYLTMIASGSMGDVSPRTAKILPLLIAKSDEVSSMLEQMIAASRLEDGRLALRTERSDVCELAEAAVQNFEPLLVGHEIHVERPPLPVWADVDPDRFEMVIRNLVSNAVKYSPASAPVTVNVSAGGNSVFVSVTDEGIGIAKSDQGKLFTRFGRIETRATAHVAGAGLGLWLSREIARMHDGDLTVESEPGKGSTFKLEIPQSHS